MPFAILQVVNSNLRVQNVIEKIFMLSVVIEAFKELVMFLCEYTICKLIVGYTATELFA